jgi:RNA polymerase primary sigma factor
MTLPSRRSDGEDGLPSYLNRLTQAPLLTAEEEVSLTRAVQAGDHAAKSKLIESNMRLVINIAKGYRNRAIPLEDLIQEGAIGLMQAAERFDPDKGFRFSTYATHWIRQAIGRAIDNKAKAIRIPAHVSQTLRKLEKVRSQLAREVGFEPSTEQLAEMMGINPKKLATLLQTSQELLSLDMNVGDSGGVTLAGLIRDEHGLDPEAAILDREILGELQGILSELNEREQRVMRMRFQLHSEDPESDEGDGEAKEHRLSRERIRQIEVQAIKNLKRIAARRNSKELLDEP